MLRNAISTLRGMYRDDREITIGLIPFALLATVTIALALLLAHAWVSGVVQLSELHYEMTH